MSNQLLFSQDVQTLAEETGLQGLFSNFFGRLVSSWTMMVKIIDTDNISNKFFHIQKEFTKYKTYLCELIV